MVKISPVTVGALINTEQLGWWVAFVVALIGVVLTIVAWLRPKFPKEVNVNRSALSDPDYVFSLRKEERLKLFEEWLNLKPVYQAPKKDPVSLELQEQLNDALPVDFSPLNDLLDFIGIPEMSLKVPQDPTTFMATSSHRDIAIKEAYKRISKQLKRDGKSQDLLSFLNRCHDYLAEEDFPQSQYDLAIVPGYRGVFRARRAAELFREGKVERIFLSGDKPSYDSAKRPNLPESIAMTIYLVDKEFEGLISRDDLILDVRARNTYDNIYYAFPKLRQDIDQDGNGVSILIVTSPYHLRRSYLMAKHEFSSKSSLINSIGRVGCYAEFMRRDWYKTEEGITAFFTEYWKLHGGRVTGEF